MIIIAGGYAALILVRPYAQLQPSVSHDTLSITTPTSNLPWPTYGQGAYGLAGGKLIATHGQQEQVPIASATKLITALVVLDRKPITVSTDGPTVTMTAADAAIYNKYVAQHGSVTPVAVGQQLTERDMLEAVLLPSANNLSDSMAIWAYGSLDAYFTAANKYLKAHGLNNTSIGVDASGLDPANASTTADLVKIGSLAMTNPVIAGVVGQKTAVVPGVGTVSNVNNLLGSNGIVGIKTGNNDQNGGVFVGATTVNANGKTITIVSALSGAPNLSTVLRDSNTFLTAARSTLAQTTVVHAGDVLATYQQPNGSQLQAVVSQDLNTVVLRGDTVKALVAINSISYQTKAGQTVGTVTIPANDLGKTQSVAIVLKQSPTPPGLWYRLTHP